MGYRNYMEPTKKFIQDNNLCKGTLLRRKKDGVTIELSGEILETPVGFNDIRNGDTKNYLAEYTVVSSHIYKHIIIHFYGCNGEYTGSSKKTSENLYGLGTTFWISLNGIGSNTIWNRWEVV